MYKVRNVAKQKLRGYHVKNAIARSDDEYIKSQGIETYNKFEPLTLPATGMVSVDPVLTLKPRVTKEEVKAKKMIMSIHDLAEEEMKGRTESFPSPQGNIHTLSSLPPINTESRGYVKVPIPKYPSNVSRNDMKITLYNKGFERDMM
jgi:hypothetical protein